MSRSVTPISSLSTSLLWPRSKAASSPSSGTCPFTSPPTSCSTWLRTTPPSTALSSWCSVKSPSASPPYPAAATTVSSARPCSSTAPSRCSSPCRPAPSLHRLRCTRASSASTCSPASRNSASSPKRSFPSCAPASRKSARPGLTIYAAPATTRRRSLQPSLPPASTQTCAPRPSICPTWPPSSARSADPDTTKSGEEKSSPPSSCRFWCCCRTTAVLAMCRRRRSAHMRRRWGRRHARCRRWRIHPWRWRHWTRGRRRNALRRQNHRPRRRNRRPATRRCPDWGLRVHAVVAVTGKTISAAHRHGVSTCSPVGEHATPAGVLEHRQRVHPLALNPHWLRVSVGDSTVRQRRPVVHRYQPGRWADMPTGNRTRRRTPAERRIPELHSRPPTQSTLSRHPAPAHAVPVVPCAAVIRQPAPRIPRDPRVAPSRIVCPGAVPIWVPALRLVVRHPHVAVAFHGIPVTVSIQVIPSRLIRSAAGLSRTRLLLCLLRNLTIAVLVPLVPCIALDGSRCHIRSIIRIEVQAATLLDCLIERPAHRRAHRPYKNRHVRRIVQIDAEN